MSIIEGQVSGAGSATRVVSIDSDTNAINVNIAGVTLTNIDAGSSGAAGDIDIFPATALKGKVKLTATDSAGDTVTAITNASQSGARTYTIPDAGGDANFVMVSSGTASAVAGAATLNKLAGVITSEALTTAAGADYTLTLTNSLIAATDIVFVSVNNGTNTTSGISVQRVTPGSGSAVVLIRNTHASSALNGTIKISFFLVKV